MIWVKNYNWEYWYYPIDNTYHPSEEMLELREKAQELSTKSILCVEDEK